MNTYQKWFEEAKANPNSKKLPTTNGIHILYKGFRLSCVSGVYALADMRFNDFYSTPVSAEDLKIFQENGFIVGANYLMYKRVKKRIDSDKKKITRHTNAKNRFEEILLQGIDEVVFPKDIAKRIESGSLTKGQAFKEYQAFCRKRKKNSKDNLDYLFGEVDYYTDMQKALERKYKFNQINGETKITGGTTTNLPKS